jgi:hypothetical protein
MASKPVQHSTRIVSHPSILPASTPNLNAFVTATQNKPPSAAVPAV